mmetsp:Transcript_48492/g.121063  ORF Transcript_48492/g.121063 Transcript_48492/m.121063 type:complete len:206 (-) Transcript_48492:24-641(-)
MALDVETIAELDVCEDVGHLAKVPLHSLPKTTHHGIQERSGIVELTLQHPVRPPGARKRGIPKDRESLQQLPARAKHVQVAQGVKDASLGHQIRVVPLALIRPPQTEHAVGEHEGQELEPVPFVMTVVHVLLVDPCKSVLVWPARLDEGAINKPNDKGIGTPKLSCKVLDKLGKRISPPAQVAHSLPPPLEQVLDGPVEDSRHLR